MNGEMNDEMNDGMNDGMNGEMNNERNVLTNGGTNGKKGLQRGLGRGLNVLIPERIAEIEESAGETIKMLDINEVEPNRSQPRRHFGEEALSELAQSIGAYGVISPIIVRRSDGYYEIVAGERRWRAARLAGLKEIPSVVREYGEENALIITLIENLQRENLTAIEEALTYKRFQEEFGLTQDEIAERVGKKRSTVANSLRLLNLPKDIQLLLECGQISVGHAKALLAAEAPDIQNFVAGKIQELNLNVRQTEDFIKELFNERPERHAKADEPRNVYAAQYRAVEKELEQILGTRVKLHNGKNKSKIEIEFFSHSDLDRLLLLFKRL